MEDLLQCSPVNRTSLLWPYDKEVERILLRGVLLCSVARYSRTPSVIFVFGRELSLRGSGGERGRELVVTRTTSPERFEFFMSVIYGDFVKG